MSQLLGEWPQNITLRDWQNAAYLIYQSKNVRDFLMVATPGAGKTTFALRIAHSMLSSGRISQIVIVAPTEHLKIQWASNAHRVGIQIDPMYSPANAAIRNDFHGIAVTYQSVATSASILRWLTAHSPTLVILDEIHHAGESLTWGDSVKKAFENAVFRIALSGTPFRGDNNTIPFVTYEQDRCKADYSYTYADSLRDGVCRYVYFPKYEGDMSWVSGRNGEVIRAKFEDELNMQQASERLNTAISSNGEWLGQVIRDAHYRLQDIRAGEHSNAGGLILAKDQTHARHIADLVAHLTGRTPALAISDEPNASRVIEDFSKGSDHWIIAVKMVSEGVDVPRLRILVYATNVVSELFFRQAVGRIIRRISGLEDQGAFFYIPSEESLIAFAQAIKEERQHQIDEPPDEYVDDDGTIRQITEPAEKIDSSFIPLSAEAQADGALFGNTELTQAELDEARNMAQDSGFPEWQTEAVAHLVRRIRQGSSAPQESINREETDPHWKQLKKQRDRVTNLINVLSSITGQSQKEIHTEWLHSGGTRQKDASLKELKEKEAWLRDLIKLAGGRS